MLAVTVAVTFAPVAVVFVALNAVATLAITVAVTFLLLLLYLLLRQ